jgi:hypothetical protein
VPLPIRSNTKLSFWCWYDIEEHKDRAFVEVSANNRSFDVIDTFTGSSNGWVLKEYPLGSFHDSSIYIRFRYTTNDDVLLDGFYVDDIYPVGSFESVSTLSSVVTGSSFSVNNRPVGAYYYRIRGYNELFGWGDFSPLTRVLVGINDNNAPSAPSIFGEIQGKPGKLYSYNVFSSDENEDDISYFIDWGDGTDSGWVGPFQSDRIMVFNHTWNVKDTFIIRAKAKDIYNAESEWRTLEVSIPHIRDRSLIFTHLFRDFFNRFFSFSSYQFGDTV